MKRKKSAFYVFLGMLVLLFVFETPLATEYLTRDGLGICAYLDAHLIEINFGVAFIAGTLDYFLEIFR
jgi:hypothetical protein